MIVVDRGSSLGGRIAAVLASVALVVALAGAPVAAAVLGYHDDGTGNPCRRCHNTAAATPALRGWNGVPPVGVPGWGTKPISNLCYACHNSNSILGAVNMTANAYGAASHGYTAASLPPKPDGTVELGMPSSGLPYTQVAQIECTSCHNVHLSTNRPFNQYTDVQLMCTGCHPGRLNNDSATSYASPGNHAYETHPTRQLLQDTARANIKAVAAVAANLKVDVSGPWALGGHLYGAASFDCLTCHAVHGPTLGTPGTKDLLAIDNVTRKPGGSALCEGCHYGGDAGQQVGTVAADGSAVIYSDHPVDAANNLAFYPTGVVIPNGTRLPADWRDGTNPNGDGGAQPFYAAAGGPTPACSSCHDTHGGMANSRLLRGPAETLAGDATWTFSYGTWCFACHLDNEVIPNGHHSTINTCNVAGGAPIDSQLDCGDCHGTLANGLNWAAHNGFWGFAVTLSPIDSAFCLGCHTASNPIAVDTTGLKNVAGSLVTPAPMPAPHGTPRGSASHYLGADSNEFAGVAAKTTAWASSGYFSSYGAPNTGGGGSVAPAAPGSIICESCHHIVYNDGRARPGSYTSARTAGWEANLLLEPYADDDSGTGDGVGPDGIGSALCIGCHAPSGSHHPLTGQIVSLSKLPLRTGAGSFADQTAAPIGGGAAPGTMSYPQANATDCDSCHRPHQADDDSTVNGAAHGAKTSVDGQPTYHILEVDGAGHLYTPSVCPECHAR